MTNRLGFLRFALRAVFSLGISSGFQAVKMIASGIVNVRHEVNSRIREYEYV